MNLFSNLPTFSLLTSAVDWPTVPELRWQLASFVIGIVVLSFGLASLALFFFQRKTADRSLVYFSVFSLLYAVRLIHGQSFIRPLLPGSTGLWKYVDLVLECFIVVPLTLFIIEIVQTPWKTVLRWLLAVQAVFGAIRLLAGLLSFGQGTMGTANNILVVAYCVVFAAYPLSLRSGQRLPQEFKVVYAGFLVFGLFIAHANLIGLGLIRGRGVEPIGFLVFVCSLGYAAAFRTHSNEQRLLAIQKELEIARQIQSSILPREVPRVAGLDIAAQYLPMTAVAGDFYDFLVIDEKRVGILVADVTGHGVPAALIASMLKTAFAAQSSFASEPAQVLAGLNRALCGKFEEHFVTAGYLFVDAEKEIVRYAGAGHPPLMFGAVNGTQATFREIDSNGLLLGLTEDATYSSLELPFRPGDRCLLYTDGMLEAKNAAQEEFGSPRFLKFLGAQSHLTAAPLVRASLAELTRWCGKGDNAFREDDITLIAVNFERIFNEAAGRNR